MSRQAVNPDGRSPYAKYAKRPYPYSEMLGKIRTARLSGNHAAADKLGREHSAAHGLRSQAFNLEV